MESESIKKCAYNLAREISDRSVYNIDEMIVLIEVRIMDGMIDFINEHSTQAEINYLKLLKEQKNRIGTPEYMRGGYELNEAKTMKAFANRAINNIKRDDLFIRLKTFVIKKYGKEIYNEFIQENEAKEPIATTRKQ